jgi:hypothetical protein
MERIRPHRCPVDDIRAAARSVVHGDLQRRVANHEVPTDDVSLNTRQQKNPIRISDDGIVLDHITSVGNTYVADTKIAPLPYKTISNQPVRTDPVAASAARKSYAATGSAEVSIPCCSIAFQLI